MEFNKEITDIAVRRGAAEFSSTQDHPVDEEDINMLADLSNSAMVKNENDFAGLSFYIDNVLVRAYGIDPQTGLSIINAKSLKQVVDIVHAKIESLPKQEAIPV